MSCWRAEWSAGSHPDLNDDSIERLFAAGLKQPGALAKSSGDPRQALAASQSTPDPDRALRSRRNLKQSCQDFEAIFIQSLFKEMRKTVPEGGLFTRSTATEMYRDMLDQEVAKEVAERQSIGLAEQMYRQMERRLADGE